MSDDTNLNDGGTGEPAPDANGDESADGNVVSATQALTTMAEAEEIWTADAMRAAQPCDVIEIDEEDVEDESDYSAQEGENLVAGGQPVDLDEPAPDTEADLDALGYSYPAPFSRWENFCDYRIYPFRTIGKLFFKRGGTGYVCSASSIGGCAIISAGHCVHAGNNSSNGWATDVVFVPAYKDGSAPFGQWPARYLQTRMQWYKNGISKGLSEDIGGAVLHKQGGQTISQRVGWLGFAWNWSRNQHWISAGYPAAAPFTGQRMNLNAASYAYNGSVGASPAPVGMGNDMTGGCSGGPWIWRFGAGNYVNGVNSYRRSSKPKELYSPYFGNAAKSLYDALRKGTC